MNAVSLIETLEMVLLCFAGVVVSVAVLFVVLAVMFRKM